ncbi:prenyltransferase/squalene oxidase repeat-containing protein [Thermococcus sp.]|uniref:prenyltransferase/squalene oxidase repeat-containing protein n=1 Tax=Thermococcus sp. TaxID=35749 RepID=UPI00260B5A3B|nr:prenyltransferase/squalene oxidase repeat-containing protein [Thermococcus sp.]
MREKLPLILLVFIAGSILPPAGASSLIGRGAEHYINEYQLRTLNGVWNTGSVSGWYAFRENETFYLTCLKVIALARSGYPRNSTEFRQLVEWIESKQSEDGSFPAIITDDYPEPDSEWFYWELSRSAGTGLAILALLEAGESSNSMEIQKAAQFLLRNESGDHWGSTVYLFWEQTGLHELNESPSIVATAYAIAALSRLGHNVSEEWRWLEERLTPERLVGPYLDNFFTDFLFPMPYRDMRGAYESIVLPLLFLREEKVSPPKETLDFISSLLERTQYLGNATLRLSFRRITNYTVEERVYTVNGWETLRTWGGTGRRAEINVSLGPPDRESIFLIRSGRALLENESGFFKGKMRLYPEFPKNYIPLIGSGYAKRTVFRFRDGEDYAVIEPPNLDGSWNHDVYSTAIALIWLHMAGAKGGNVDEALRFLELASPRESMAFDGDAYALIALSLYGEKWEANGSEPVESESNAQSGISWSLPAVFGIGLLIGVLIGAKMGRK